MHYLDFLGQVHDLLKPRSYLEIGVRHGHSMALSSVPSIGIDPAYAIAEDVQLGPGVTLHQETSDDHFAGPSPLAALDQPVIDFSFIDGLHLYEFVLRDFMAGVAKFSSYNKTFWMYALFNLAAFLFLYRKMPELTGHSLEDIEHHLADQEFTPADFAATR